LPADALPADASPADKDPSAGGRGGSADRPAPASGDPQVASGRQLFGSPSGRAAPASLYFNPRLATDADGYVTIEFQMPEVESEYRVLIDAFGQGRIGSAEVLIMCRK
jgi:uncharacterized protein YfaS (alpha-2-macroglobulin family)